MDTELFELCKEVYKRFPTWNNKEKMFWKRLIDDNSQAKLLNYGQVTTRDGAMVCPLYTTDYLLEKLSSGAGVIKDFDGYTARRPSSYGIPEDKDPLNGRIGWQAETAVKALLTMIISLDNANQLPHEEKE